LVRTEIVPFTATTGHFPSRVSGSRVMTRTGASRASAVSLKARASAPIMGGWNR
jgi:hypothetical protein